MATTPKPVTCKSCHRTLATMSEGGLVPAISSDNHGCSTCQLFGKLYENRQAADEAYEPLSNKGDKHRGKQAAVMNVNKTHMILDNWLISVEAPGAQENEQPDEAAEHKGHEEAKEPKDGAQLQRQDMKRVRPHSPASQDSKAHNTLKEEVEGSPSPHAATQFLQRPSPKRSHSMTSLPGRKRIKFSDSVEFRDDYRSYLELSRSRKEYVPGRYAPPEGGYLDTSGSEQTFPKFTGVKKVRGEWVQVQEKNEKCPSSRMKRATQPNKLQPLEENTAQQEMNGTSQDTLHQSEGVTLSTRALRLAERKKRASSAEALQNMGVEVAQRGRRRLLERVENVTLVSSTNAAPIGAMLDSGETHDPTNKLKHVTQGNGTDTEVHDQGTKDALEPSMENATATTTAREAQEYAKPGTSEFQDKHCSQEGSTLSEVHDHSQARSAPEDCRARSHDVNEEADQLDTAVQVKLAQSGSPTGTSKQPSGKVHCANSPRTNEMPSICRLRNSVAFTNKATAKITREVLQHGHRLHTEDSSEHNPNDVKPALLKDQVTAIIIQEGQGHERKEKDPPRLHMNHSCVVERQDYPTKASHKGT
ncbi:hypothetical protein BKA66DRAFT_4530 [Pyrenochaeta sp. MPI-SDFR-AT-0127]|nr:hypothetical protein BKA66DRAFT_4530 [Pyrenochaeta sp. MPI-SDFR-AT-0127]